MSSLRREDGFTLSELLIGMVLMMIVMSSTLLVLDQFTTLGKQTDRRMDVQDAARTATRQIARSLRNLAASPDRPGVVERAGAYDIVFRTVDGPRADAGANTRNLRRVRYCLDASDPARGRVLEQTQRWSSTAAPAVPAGTGCPAAGWSGSPRVVADRVTNRADGVDRPLWSYTQSAGAIAAVKLNLFMNAEPANRSREVDLQTGVFLRNQNRAPTAQFTATAVGERQLVLNGSDSTDPEGQALDFHWFVNGTEVGRGLLYDFYAPAAGTYRIQLRVFDLAGVANTSAEQTVVIS